MNFAPITKNIDTYAQKLQKEGRVVVQSLTQAPGEKMGAWTMRGYGMPNAMDPGKLLFRSNEFAKPLNSINYIV